MAVNGIKISLLTDNSSPLSTAEFLFAEGGDNFKINKADLYADITSNVGALYVPLTQKGTANGVATLDGSGVIPITQLPTDVMQYKGDWDAGTNSPALIDGTGNTGDYYLVSVGGTRDLGSGSNTYAVGDRVIYDGAVWDRIPGSSPEVNDLTSSVTWANIPDVNVPASAVTQHESLIDHDALANFVASEHIDWTTSNTNRHYAASTYLVGDNPLERGHVRFYEAGVSGTNYTEVRATDSIASNNILTLPLSSGTIAITSDITGDNVESPTSTLTVTSSDRIFVFDADDSNSPKYATVSDINALGEVTQFGLDNEIPFTNITTDDFDYSSDFTFDGATFKTPRIDVDNIRVDGNSITTVSGDLTISPFTNDIYLTPPSATLAGTDKVLFMDTSDLDKLRYATSQSIADLYTETDTLATVTGRGATTSTPSSFTGGLTVTASGTQVLSLTRSGTTDITIGNTGSGNTVISHSGSGSILIDGFAFTNAKATNWDEAYSWGDHALAGYLTSETDSQTLAFTVGTGDLSISNGNTVNLDGRYYSKTEVDAFAVSKWANDSGYITGITGEPLSDLSDVTITTIASGEILKWNGAGWINNTLAEAGIAASIHTHATSDITDLSSYTGFDVRYYTEAEVDALTWDASDIISGTFADARIAASNVTQHQAALSITESQISDLGNYAESLAELSDVVSATNTNRFALMANGTTGYVGRALVEADISDFGTYLTDITGETLSDLADIPAYPNLGSLTYVLEYDDNTNTFSWVDSSSLGSEVNDLTSAVTWANVPDANITQSSVTQHQAALSITESQISDLGSYVEMTGATANGILTYNAVGDATVEQYLTYNETAGLNLQVAAQSGTRETLMKATTSDGGNDQFGIVNGTSTNGRYIPTFSGYAESTNTLWSLGLRGIIPSTDDTNSTNWGAVTIQAIRSTSGSDPNNGTLSNITGRNLFVIGGISSTDIYLTLDASHDLTVNDGIFIDSAGGTSTQWNEAYSWGDHALEGYLTDITGQSLSSLSDVPAYPNTGSANYYLDYNDGTNTFTWVDVSTLGGGSSPLTTKGDLYTYSTVDARLPVGTNGQILSADSTEATGLKWIDAASQGDMEALGVVKTTNQTYTTETDVTSWATAHQTSTDISFNATTGIATFNTTGLYLIVADFSTQVSSGSSRSSSDVYMSLDSGAGYSEVLGTRRNMYNRLANNGGASATISYVYSATAGDDIKFRIRRENGTDTTVLEDAALSIVRLTGAKGDTGPAGGTTMNGSTSNGVLTYDTAGNATVESNLTFNGSTLSVTGAVSATGAVTGSNLNVSNWDTAFGWGDHALEGYLTGNQTITLSGDLSGSGTTSINATIASSAVEASMLNNNIISGQTDLTSGLTSTDEFLVSDAGVIKRMDVSVFDAYINGSIRTITDAWTFNDASITLGADLNANNLNIDQVNSIYLNEKASANADITSDGQIWVKNDSPNVPMYTDDAGTDFEVMCREVYQADTLGTATTTFDIPIDEDTHDYLVIRVTASDLDAVTMGPTSGTWRAWTLHLICGRISAGSAVIIAETGTDGIQDSDNTLTSQGGGNSFGNLGVSAAASGNNIRVTCNPVNVSGTLDLRWRAFVTHHKTPLAP